MRRSEPRGASLQNVLQGRRDVERKAETFEVNLKSEYNEPSTYDLTQMKLCPEAEIAFF